MIDLNKYERLLVHIAKQYQGLGVDLDDLYQEGYIALLVAARRFDPGKRVAFTTFADHCIRNALRSAIAEQSRTIRVPKHVRQLMAAAARNQALDAWDQALVDHARRAHGTQSLDPLAPVLDRRTAEATAAERDARYDVAEALPSLDEREREAIDLYYCHEYTFREIACRFGVSRERARNFVREAVATLRERLTAYAA